MELMGTRYCTSEEREKEPEQQWQWEAVKPYDRTNHVIASKVQTESARHLPSFYHRNAMAVVSSSFSDAFRVDCVPDIPLLRQNPEFPSLSILPRHRIRRRLKSRCRI
ncbi:hypothetical protein C8Q70DRAFT_1014334, partial [Cubamyces menziesii]